MSSPEALVKQLTVYQANSKGTYRGISRHYFPKWEGWKLLENMTNIDELEKAVESFYLNYFYYSLNLDKLSNPSISFLLFNFATLEGKKKTISKLQQIAPTIEQFNSYGKEGEYKLLLEILEFYNYTSNTNTQWVYNIYKECTI